jgi:hypothetical protein
VTEPRPDDSPAASRSRRRWPWALGLLAAASVITATLWWWQGGGASSLLRAEDLAQALSKRWNLQVEVQGLELEPRAAGAVRARIARLVAHDPETGFTGHLEQVTVQALGRTLDTLQLESLRATRGALVVELDAAGRPRLPAAFVGTGEPARLPQLEVQSLELTLRSAALTLHAPAVALRTAATAGAAPRLALTAPRAELTWGERRAQLSELELSFDAALAAPRGQTRFAAALLERDARELKTAPVSGHAQLADGRVALELELAPRTLRAPGRDAELGQLAGRAQLSAELGRWQWAGQAQGTLHATALAALGELPWSGALQLHADELDFEGTLQVAGTPWQLDAKLAEAGLRSANASAKAAPLGAVVAALASALGSSWTGQDELRGDLELHFEPVADAAGVRAELRLPSATLGDLTFEGLVIGFSDDGSASGAGVRASAVRARWQGLEARTVSAELRPARPADAASWSGRITLPELGLDEYLARATGVAELRGHAAASVELKQAASRDASAWAATLTLSSLTLSQGSVELSATEPLVAELAAGRLRLRATRFAAPDSELMLAGEGSLAEGAAFTLTGQTRLARLVQVYDSVQSAEGVVEHDLRLSGPWAAPRLGGTLQIRDAHLHCFGEAFEAASATLRLEAGALHFEQAQARVRDGRVELGGRIELDGLRVGAAALQIRAGDFAIEPVPEGRAKLRLEAQLQADAPGAAARSGTASNAVPRLTGTLSVLRGAYRRALPLAALPALLAQGLGAGEERAEGQARFALDLALAFEPPIQIRNNLADVALSVDRDQGLRLIGTDAEPRLRGRLQLDGRLLFQTNEFQLDQAGFVFRPDTGLWPRTELSAATARGVRLQLSGPPTDLSLSVRCESAPDAQRPFECRLRGADARCDRFEELVARFQCTPAGSRID